MAPAPDPKMNVNRADQDPKQAEKMRLLKELAKATKPVKDGKKGE